MCSVFDNAYSQYFGFTTSETSQLLDSYDLELTSGVQEMYDGYRFGDCEMYSSWSLLNYASSGTFIPYWSDTSSKSLILKTVLGASQEFFDHFNELIKTGAARVSVNLHTSFVDTRNDESLWGMLINAGYLTIGRHPDLLTGFCEVHIPNLEVRRELLTIIT